jgi:hypothetical protein
MLKRIFPIVLIGEEEEREKQRLAAAEETAKKRKALLLMRLRGMIRERSYLTSQALIPSATSPWNQLDKAGTDKNFLNILGLTRGVFDALLHVFSQHYIIRSGPGRRGRPTRLLDKRTVLALLLHFYTSMLDIKILCELFGSPPSTTQRTLRNAEAALELALAEIPDAAIRWPSETEQKMWAGWITTKEPVITKKFGFIDGKNYRVQEPTHSNLQNAMYNSWLHSVFVTSTVAFGADGCIIWMKHNCPGSWNDGETSRGFQEMLQDARLTLQDHGVLADSAFPVSGEMSRRIVTPLKQGDLARAIMQGGNKADIIIVNNAIISIRQAAE